MAIIHVEEKDFEKELQSDKIVLVDFYADWCGPCRMLTPILEELDSDRSDTKIVKINVDEAPNLAAKFGVMSIPTLAIFKNGKLVTKEVGLRSKDQIMEMISQ